MARRPVSIVVIDVGEHRFIESIFADGETVRTRVDPKKKPTRRPRRPQTRARITDHTKNKPF